MGLRDDAEEAVLIERVSDNKRFKRVIKALGETDALIVAHALLLKEPDDYYIIDIKPAR